MQIDEDEGHVVEVFEYDMSNPDNCKPKVMEDFQKKIVSPAYGSVVTVEISSLSDNIKALKDQFDFKQF
jgi:hypothetical protein